VSKFEQKKNDRMSDDKIKSAIIAGQTLRFVNFLLDTSIYFVIILGFILIFKDVINKENVKWIDKTVEVVPPISVHVVPGVSVEVVPLYSGQ